MKPQDRAPRKPRPSNPFRSGVGEYGNECEGNPIVGKDYVACSSYKNRDCPYYGSDTVIMNGREYFKCEHPYEDVLRESLQPIEVRPLEDWFGTAGCSIKSRL